MESWTTDKVCQWLVGSGFEKYSSTFRNEDIDGLALIHLRDEEIFKLLTLIDTNGIRRDPSSKLQREFRRKLDELQQSNGQQRIPTKMIKSKDQKSKTFFIQSSDRKFKFFQSPSILAYLTKKFQIQFNISSTVHSETKTEFSIEFIGNPDNLSIAVEQIESIFSSIDEHIFNDEILDKKIIKYSKEIHSESSFVVLQKIFLEKNRLTVWEKSNVIGGYFRVLYLRGNGLFQSSIDFIRQILNSDVTMNKDSIQVDLSSMSTKCREEFDRYRQIKSNSSTMTMISLPNPFKRELRMILFGLKSTIRLAKNQFHSLIDKYRMKTIQLDLNLSEREFLLDHCHEQLKQIEFDHRSSEVNISIRKNSFIAPKCLVRTIRHSILSLIDQTTTLIYPFISNSIEFNETFQLKLKRFAESFHCHLKDVKIKRKSQSFLLPNRSSITKFSSKYLQTQSDRFTSTFPRHQSLQIGSNLIEIHSSSSSSLITIDFEILSTMDDAQREQIPSTEQNHYLQSIDGKRILFIHWSPSFNTMEKFFSSSLDLIVDNGDETVKTIRYSTTDWQKSSCQRDFLPTLIKLLSTDRFVDRSWTILFVCDQHQKDLFNDFLQSFPSDHPSGFYLPISTLTMTLKGREKKDLPRCRKQIEEFIEEKFLRIDRISRPFDASQWNQSMVNAFYQFSLDENVLPRLGKELELIGRVQSVEKVKEKYQFISRTNSLRKPLKQPNLLLSCSVKDQINVTKLNQRLTDEGFTVQIDHADQKHRSRLSMIDRTDFILICSTSNYFNETNCQIVLETIKSSSKKFIPIVFSPSDGENCWIETMSLEETFYRIFQEEIRFRFDENLDQLIDALRRHRKAEMTDTISPSSDFNPNETTAKVEIDREEKRRIYDLKIEMIQEKERIPSDEIDPLICKMRLVVDDLENQSSISSCFIDQIRRWIDKAMKGSMIRGNLPPFTLTDDWNDSIFPISDEKKEPWWEKTERDLKPFDHSISIEDDRPNLGSWINDDQSQEHYGRLIDRDRQFTLEIQRTTTKDKDKYPKFYRKFDNSIPIGTASWDFRNDRAVIKEYRRQVKGDLPPPPDEKNRSKIIRQRLLDEKVRWYFRWKNGELKSDEESDLFHLSSETRNQHEQEQLDKLDQSTNKRWEKILASQDKKTYRKGRFSLNKEFLRQKCRNLSEWKQLCPE